jgi:hypothetical protein
VSNGGFSALSSTRETETSRAVVDDDSHVIFGGKFPGEKGSMRRIVVIQQPILLSPMFGTTSLHILAHLA